MIEKLLYRLCIYTILAYDNAVVRRLIELRMFLNKFVFCR